MRILIDIGHPAHVHLFKHFAWIMLNKGHHVLFTTREKEFEIELLSKYKFQFISFGIKYSSIPGKILGLLKFDLMMLRVAIKYKPDLFLSHGSIYAAHIAWVLKRKHISFEDTFNFEQINLYKPFTSTILTSTYNHPHLGPKNIRYRGYHELAYLHPNRFKPDRSIFKALNIDESTKFVLLRFVSWEASHDIGHCGISIENKIKAIHEFRNYARVFISSEKQLPKELIKYKINISPDMIHDVIAFASLLYGESATMVSEAAVLGTPAIYLDSTGRYYTEEQEREYDLIYNYSESSFDQNRSIQKGIEILKNDLNDVVWERKKLKLLNEKIDVTAFLVWFVENYPESKNKIKLNPDYQLRFK